MEAKKGNFTANRFDQLHDALYLLSSLYANPMQTTIANISIVLVKTFRTNSSVVFLYPIQFSMVDILSAKTATDNLS